MSGQIDPVQFGQLLEAVNGLKASADRFERKAEDLERQVAALSKAIANAKGKWSALVGVALFVGGLVEGLHYFISVLKDLKH